jgi:peptidoglycan-associated lipoprotein
MNIKNKSTVALFSLLLLAGCSTGHNFKPTSHVESSLMSEFERNVGDRVFFAYDSSELSHASKVQLDKQIAWLKDHPSVKATIEGHADERGTREYNLALGERRAEAARKYLGHHGIEASRLDTISYGKERPAAIGNNEDAFKQNRRSVTTVR